MRKLAILISLVILAVAAAALLLVPLAAREIHSPDGAFIAVVRTRLIDSLWPVMPGHGSDKPASVTIYRKDGRSCGSADLPMLSFVYDLTWTLNGTPRTARIGPVATWDLDACSVSS